MIVATNYKDQPTDSLLLLVQEMETTYAEAFDDETSDGALRELWKQIKMIKNEIGSRTGSSCLLTDNMC